MNDEETGWYYLRSRYYNPEWGRFVNADTLLAKVGSVVGSNTFTYTLNNPVCRKDSDGGDSYLLIYDARPDAADGGKGFPNQMTWWENKLLNEGHHVEVTGYTTIDEFIERWNSVENSYDNIIMIMHGAEGTLDCAGT